MKIDVLSNLRINPLYDVRAIRGADLLGIQYPRRAQHGDICPQCGVEDGRPRALPLFDLWV